MPPEPKTLTWPDILFLALVPPVTALILAPSFGFWFSEWPAVSLEALGILALAGTLCAPGEPPGWWS
jgi:hypothetical protein